ncbi:MAG: hypothetical protein GX977_06290, partial [Firmicutes bacterium]|nr:hypothetical protein [Bacillota bacterium]
MASRKILIAGMTLAAIFFLMVGIGAADMAVQGELESVLVDTLVEVGFDPTSEDVVRAANTVLVELKEEYGDTEQLLSMIKDDPTVVARISVL